MTVQVGQSPVAADFLFREPKVSGMLTVPSLVGIVRGWQAFSLATNNRGVSLLFRSGQRESVDAWLRTIRAVFSWVILIHVYADIDA